MENFRLQVFRTVGETLSFRRAAEILHLSQPAVSKHIQLLEQQVGSALFDRAGRTISMTPAGTLLLKQALESVAILDRAARAIAAMRGEALQSLRLAASTTIAQYLLPRILGRFLQLHPSLDLRVSSANTEHVVAALLNGEAELGLLEGPPLNRAIHTEPFFQDRLVLIAPATSSFTGRTISAEQLQTLPLLLREPGSGSRRTVEQQLRKAALPPSKLRILMELDSTEAIVSGVEAGLGYGFVSQLAAIRSVRLGLVNAVKVRGVAITRPFTLAYLQGGQLSRCSQDFRDHVRNKTETFHNLELSVINN